MGENQYLIMNITYNTRETEKIPIFSTYSTASTWQVRMNQIQVNRREIDVFLQFCSHFMSTGNIGTFDFKSILGFRLEMSEKMA